MNLENGKRFLPPGFFVLRYFMSTIDLSQKIKTIFPPGSPFKWLQIIYLYCYLLEWRNTIAYKKTQLKKKVLLLRHVTNKLFRVILMKKYGFNISTFSWCPDNSSNGVRTIPVMVSGQFQSWCPDNSSHGVRTIPVITQRRKRPLASKSADGRKFLRLTL